MAGTQGIRAGNRVAASGDPVGIGVISASELKGRGRGRESLSLARREAGRSQGWCW